MSSGRASRSADSIARRISRSAWLHRLLAFLFVDAVALAALAFAFVAQCDAQLASEALAVADVSVDAAAPASLSLQDIAAFAESLAFRAVLADGEERVFPLAPVLSYAAPVAGAVLAAEALSLVTAAHGAPAVRRKLRPLNELALTAEAVGSAAAGGAPSGRAEQLDSLQRAIASATVDSPQISTGDEDLRSIEVALNGLLRRMQEAKQQQARFVDDVSHELRTPIAVIDGYVSMLDRWGKTDPEVLDESIEALKGESGHMKELVEQLLFLARGDAGRTRLNREPLDLGELVREVRDESAMIDPAHEYVLGGPGAADGAAIMQGDVALIKQAMRIMVQNAAKYSPAGAQIRLAAVSRPGAAAAARPARPDPPSPRPGAAGAARPGADASEVGFLVQDEGMGMSAQDERHAFERFWRSDEARGGSAEGSGLGLSIAKWIVDAHGGRIEVLSVEGVGTRFAVWFQASRAPAAA